MKIHIYFILFSVALLFSACQREQEDLFSESAALRLNHAVEKTKNTILGAENGWVLQYFPTRTSGGQTFLVSFDEDGLSRIAVRNEYFPEYTVKDGTFDVLGESGPLITFNSYNDVFHIFSDPKDPLGENDDLNGLGLQGDYEFIVLNSDKVADVLEAKGKKRATRIFFKKLASDQDWKEYIDNLHEFDRYLFDPKVPKLSMFLGNTEFIATNGAAHILHLSHPNVVGPPAEELPFIVTTTGIRFYEPFDYDGIIVENFNLSEDKSRLVSAENSNAYITGPSPELFLDDAINWTGSRSWQVDPKNLGGSFATSYANIVKNCAEIYNQEFIRFYLANRNGKRSLSFNSGRFTGSFYINTSIDENNNYTFINTGTADNNGQSFLKNIPGFDSWLETLFEGAYLVTPDSPLKPTTLKLTSKINPENWFQINLN